jgi:hypothetical protein
VRYQDFSLIDRLRFRGQLASFSSGRASLLGTDDQREGPFNDLAEFSSDLVAFRI